MTKTTNYEISKKLAEIGFRAECSYFYFHSDNNDYEASSLEEFGYNKISDCDIEDKYYPAYDLESLLDALPEIIRNNEKLINEELILKKNYIGYFFWDSGEFFCSIGAHKQENESLADIAGRVIIKLHEKNLIKF